MIEDAQEEDVVERAEAGFGELVEIEDAIVNLRVEFAMDLEEGGDLDAIDGGDLCAAPFRLETEPAVPCAGIEQAPALEGGGDGVLTPAPLESVERNDAFESCAVRQFEAVVPAFGVQLLTEIGAPAGRAHG